jgi:endonuclease YncB( thermonuclease family)
MFKVLRKTLIVLLVGSMGVVAYAYLRNADHRRQIAQTAEELREDLKEEKRGYAWTGTAVVVDAVKGDRVKVDLETSRKVLVRLAGIDAPELPLDRFHKGQPLAEESRDYLGELLKGKAVEMAVVGTDAIKTPVVLLTLDGALVNAKVAEAGYAEVTPETLELMPAKIRHAVQNAELRAKRNNRGIWGLTNYVRPVEFRIRHSGSQKP